MHKDLENVKLQGDFLHEGGNFIAYSPALDLATHGKTMAEARKSFEEAAELFFETIIENGTYKNVLHNLGWNMQEKRFMPPLIVSRDIQSISIPIHA